MGEGSTHHLERFNQILHNQALLLRSDVSDPHPPVLQFIVNDKHVAFQETGGMGWGKMEEWR